MLKSKALKLQGNLIGFSAATREAIQAAVREDVGGGDLTSNLLIPAQAQGKAEILARESGVFCGRPVLSEVFKSIDKSMEVNYLVKEGGKYRANQKVMTITGKTRSILSAERTALNFLGHLCGISTRTRQYVDAVKKYHVLILDTRKTTPLWREIEKYAVRTGGGRNHRMGLFDAVFIKENHRPQGDFKQLEKYRGEFEIEVRSMEELKKALVYQPRVVLFDNFSPSRLKRAVDYARKKSPETILEASGGMTLDTVEHYACMGVDWISVGALTHSVKCADFSLLLK